MDPLNLLLFFFGAVLCVWAAQQMANLSKRATAFWRGRNVLIFGANRPVGMRLCARAASLGADVVAVIDKNGPDAQALESLGVARVVVQEKEDDGAATYEAAKQHFATTPHAVIIDTDSLCDKGKNEDARVRRVFETVYPDMNALPDPVRPLFAVIGSELGTVPALGAGLEEYASQQASIRGWLLARSATLAPRFGCIYLERSIQSHLAEAVEGTENLPTSLKERVFAESEQFVGALERQLVASFNARGFDAIMLRSMRAVPLLQASLASRRRPAWRDRLLKIHNLVKLLDSKTL
ncbi:MAG: hypothetical protein MHM6MM_001586 [Cercozoa sp. M6MM]